MSMKKRTFADNDRDLIIALTDDYLNVYRVTPEEGSIDVIKLDGFITEGIEGSMEGLSYATLLDNYTKSRVYAEDQEMFKSELNLDHIQEVLKYKNIFQGRYRVVENGEIHYYAYKYVKVSAEDEQLRLVAAFRNVDAIENKDRKRIAELEKLKGILATSEIATWELKTGRDGITRLYADDKMKQLMGVPKEAKISAEELIEILVSGINPADMAAFGKYDNQLHAGLRSECTYRWTHPFLGERYIRCGGVKVESDNDNVFVANGYHYDVTDQVTRENRSSQIIRSFAHSYEFINYIHLPEGTFFTYSDKGADNEDIIDILLSGDVYRAIEVTCNNFVSEEHRDMVVTFLDLNTIDERMKHSNVLLCQFKNKGEEWYETSFSVAERGEGGTITDLLWAVRKIDDEKQVEIRRQKQLEDNIAANKAKTKFLHNMSHEIRTPLNALFGFAQLLGLPDGTWSDEEKETYNNYVYSSYSMLDMLISDIIDIADSEHGNYRVEITETAVNNVCANSIMSVDYRKPEGVEMYYTSEVPNDYIVQSDGRRIQQVLTNFLTNACKNTKEGEIHLHCSNTENPGKLTFSVTDTGIGVPKEKADLIFNRFIKLDQNMQGAGLGLNICVTIANKLGGEVYLDKTYTNGARFVFTIEDKKS